MLLQQSWVLQDEQSCNSEFANIVSKCKCLNKGRTVLLRRKESWVSYLKHSPWLFSSWIFQGKKRSHSLSVSLHYLRVWEISSLGLPTLFIWDFFLIFYDVLRYTLGNRMMNFIVCMCFLGWKKLNKEYENNLCNGYHHLTVVMALPSVLTSLNPIPFAVWTFIDVILSRIAIVFKK